MAWISGCSDSAATFAKPNLSKLPDRRCMRTQNDLVTVLEKAALFARCKANRLLSTPGCLKQTTEAGGIGRRNCTRTEEITRPKRATVRGVMGYELSYSPIHVSRAAKRHAMRWQTLFPETGRDKK